ncbi:hypothetical protein [Embleya hyalina]|uniref:hypothetical protein n=1 Tax=Embleya hyalina TaxID=516124 RepID=UPI000F81691C|nr:hypothetical protein [Embleya hyalina]
MSEMHAGQGAGEPVSEPPALASMVIRAFAERPGMPNVGREIADAKLRNQGCGRPWAARARRGRCRRTRTIGVDTETARVNASISFAETEGPPRS